MNSSAFVFNTALGFFVLFVSFVGVFLFVCLFAILGKISGLLAFYASILPLEPHGNKTLSTKMKGA
jgi:hypothetical protein